MKRNSSSAPENISHFYYYWLPVILYAGAIFLLSSLPGSSYPETPSGMDKLVHVLEYALLAFLLYRALIHSPKLYLCRHAFWLSILFSVLYGFSDELHQLFVPERSLELWDMFSDTLGAVGAALASRKYL